LSLQFGIRTDAFSFAQVASRKGALHRRFEDQVFYFRLFGAFDKAAEVTDTPQQIEDRLLFAVPPRLGYLSSQEPQIFDLGLETDLWFHRQAGASFRVLERSSRGQNTHADQGGGG
jgi:hypothetical protein